MKGTPKQQVGIQHDHHVAKTKSNIQSTQVLQNSNYRTPKTQPTSTQYVKHTHSSSNHVVPNNSQKYRIAKRKGISFSRQTAKPQHRTIVKHATVHHKVTPATVKFQKENEGRSSVHKHPQWLSQATKRRERFRHLQKSQNPRHHELQRQRQNLKPQRLKLQNQKSQKLNL